MEILKHKYLKIVLKYSTGINVFSYFPPLLICSLLFFLFTGFCIFLCLKKTCKLQGNKFSAQYEAQSCNLFYNLWTEMTSSSTYHRKPTKTTKHCLLHKQALIQQRINVYIYMHLEIAQLSQKSPSLLILQKWQRLKFKVNHSHHWVQLVRFVLMWSVGSTIDKFSTW